MHTRNLGHDMADDPIESPKDATSHWQSWLPWLLLTYTVIAPTFAVLFGNNAGAGVLGAVGAAALVMTRLQDITKFALFGLKAELRKAVREANATTAQLRDLAVSLAEPSLNYMSMHGVMLSQLTFESQYTSKVRIVSALRRLKVSEAKIKEVSQFWIEIALRKLSNVMAQRLHTINPTIVDEFVDKIRLVNDRPTTTARIDQFLKKADIDDAEIMQLLSDYDHLAQTGEVRRPEVIEVGVQP
jgi:hypothetical protein